MKSTKTLTTPYYGQYTVRLVGVVDAFKDGVDTPCVSELFGSYTVDTIIPKTSGVMNPVFLLWVPVKEDNQDYTPQGEFRLKLPKMKNGQISKKDSKLPIAISEKKLNTILAKNGEKFNPLCCVAEMTLSEIVKFYENTYKDLMN